MPTSATTETAKMAKEIADQAAESGKEVVESATPNIDAFVGKVNSALDVITTQIIDVAPKAADLLLRTIQFKGIFEVVVGFVFLLVTVTLGWLVRNAIRKLIAQEADKSANNEASEVANMFVACAGSVAAVGFGIATISYLCSFEAWVAAVFPEAALAMKALAAVGVNL